MNTKTRELIESIVALKRLLSDDGEYSICRSDKKKRCGSVTIYLSAAC